VKHACSDLERFVFDLNRKALPLPLLEGAFRCSRLV
jgi:hypothetical protein